MKFDLYSVKNELPKESFRQAHTPPYTKAEVNLQLCAQTDVYLPYGRQYAAKFGTRIVTNMQQAIDARKNGEFVLTIREADTAARNQLPLSSRLLIRSMVYGIDGLNQLGLISEGIPGVEGNAFELRNQYNKGVQFYKTGKYEIAPAAQKTAADKRMKLLKLSLNELGLPLWPEEVDGGLATELLKPEYMSWHQYQEAAAQRIFLFDTNAAYEFETEDEESEVASVNATV